VGKNFKNFLSVAKEEKICKLALKIVGETAKICRLTKLKNDHFAIFSIK